MVKENVRTEGYWNEVMAAIRRRLLAGNTGWSYVRLEPDGRITDGMYRSKIIHDDGEVILWERCKYWEPEDEDDVEDQLIEIRKNMEHELAKALDYYTDPSLPGYDPDFDKKIRELRPDWFLECQE